MKDTVNRNPTKKQILAALNECCTRKRYVWHGKGYWSDGGNGETLWQALLDDARNCSSQHRSIFDQWADKYAEQLMEDKEFREEYMPTCMYRVFIRIGNKNREINIAEVRAGNEKQAIDKCRQDIGAEFLGLKYTIHAEHAKPEEFMTEEKFTQMCYDRAYEESGEIEHMIDDINDDKDVARFFGIDFDIESWELDGTDWEINKVKAICKECGCPLTEEHLEYEEGDIPECWNCPNDLRSPDIKVRDAI